jgi:hypothetical protein
MADLKPGGLGSPAEGAIPPAFADSMAAAMETALNSILAGEGKDKVPVDNTPESRDRRTMFAAIAQGIVNHLVQNQAAFVIKDTLGNPVALHIDINHV